MCMICIYMMYNKIYPNLIKFLDNFYVMREFSRSS